MTQEDNKVLACVDLSPYAEHVADHAAWAAARMGAPLEFLHVINRHSELQGAQDHSGAIGANAEENLLKNLSEQDAVRTRAEREHARGFLNNLRARAEAAGAGTVDTRQRHGDLAETLSEQQAGVRLCVLGRRGASANVTQRDLGRHVEWVVRSLQCPVLVVPETFNPHGTVLVAYDGSSGMRRGIEKLAASPLLKGLPLRVLMSGKPQAQAPAQLDWAVQTLRKAGFETQGNVVPGAPETVIRQAIGEHEAGLLVMGGYSHSPLRSLLLGSRTRDLLRTCAVPALLLR